MSTDLKADQEAIRNIVQRWFEAENRKDVEATMGFMSKDVVLQAPNMPQIEGEKAVRDFFAAFFGSLISVSGGTNRVVISESGDMAYGIGPNRIVMEGQNGRIEDEGKWFIAWMKLGGEWKAVAASFSSDEPAD